MLLPAFCFFTTGKELSVNLYLCVFCVSQGNPALQNAFRGCAERHSLFFVLNKNKYR